MDKEITASRVWQEYERGVCYNTELNLYETVRQNENFFIGKQWEGVAAPDLDKPTFNILKRVVSYFISTIASDDVSAQVSAFGGADQQTENLLRAVNQEFDRIIENNRLKAKNRDCIRNAAVDGDACLYFWYDTERARGLFSTGEIVAEEIDNTNVYFGNPQIDDIQRQPYVIVSRRVMLEDARREARENGLDPDAVHADDDPNGMNREHERGKVTTLLRFWKEKDPDTGEKTVWWCKACQGAMLREPVNLGYKLYPLAWWCWDRVKNSCHGQSCITGLIPNQIFINKLYAMCMEHVKKMAFPKIAYNRMLLPGGWSNRAGEAIPVNGDPNLAIAANLGGADMSGQVVALIEKTISYTRDTMGASDAALGNIKPDNTSAIIAVQKSTQAPLELQRMAFFDFVEQYIRVFLEIMRVDYGLRQVQIPTQGEENGASGIVDFSGLESLRLKLNVDIGAGSLWSELAQVQTLDGMYANQLIPDPVTYLECLPDGYVKNKEKIISRWKELQRREQPDAQTPGAEELPQEAAAPQNDTLARLAAGMGVS